MEYIRHCMEYIQYSAAPPHGALSCSVVNGWHLVHMHVCKI